MGTEGILLPVFPVSEAIQTAISAFIKLERKNAGNTPWMLTLTPPKEFFVPNILLLGPKKTLEKVANKYTFAAAELIINYQEKSGSTSTNLKTEPVTGRLTIGKHTKGGYCEKNIVYINPQGKKVSATEEIPTIIIFFDNRLNIDGQEQWGLAVTK